MASIKKRGKSYLIIVSCGYGANKEKLSASMTWTPPEGMKEKTADKEANKIGNDFEAKVKRGHFLQGEKVTFKEFCETWFKDHADKQLKPKTLESYHYMLNSRILPAIGHHTLADIKPPILIKLLNALQDDLNENNRYQAKEGIREVWKASGLKRAGAGVSRDTLTQILQSRHVSLATAERFAAALKLPFDSLFGPAEIEKKLSARTVGYYLRCISTILSTAVVWQLIESNPCDRVKAPKVVQKKIKYLEVEETEALIRAAMGLTDWRTRAAFLTFLMTGIRKGELCGLRWSDFDLDKGQISINRTIQQIDGQGLVEGSPKSDSGERTFSISAGLVAQLRSYRDWQQFEIRRQGDRWQRKERELWVSQAPGSEKPDPSQFVPVDWVFASGTGYPLHPSTVYHWIKAFLIDQGHPDMTVHGLRHSNISHQLSQGIDLITVSRRAGHAKPSITADIYAHALKRPDEAAAEKLDELFGPSMKNIN